MSTQFYLNQYVTTTLAKVGGLNTTDTTGIIFSSIAGIDTTHPGIALFSYSDPLDTSKCEWISYTSINPSTYELQGVVRGCEGFSAHNHDNGCAIAFPISKSHINNIPDSTTTFTNKDLTDSSNKIPGITGLNQQAIINGNFDVWQRGTSFTMTAASATYGPDRWRDSTGVDGGTNPTLTRTRQVLTAGELPGSFFSNRLTTNGAGTSLGAGSYFVSKQCIEHGVRNLCGLNKKVTLSFWAKSDIANKKIGINIRQVYGTGGSPTAVEEINGASWTLTSTLTKYTHTFTTNTLSGKTFGTAYDDFLEYQFWYAWGTTYKDKVGAAGAETYVGAGNIDIAQVQLCAGDVALPFMPKSFEEELRACQRYYEKSWDYGVAEYTATSAGYEHQYALITTAIAARYTTVHYSVPKRNAVVPTICPYTTPTNTSRVSDSAGTDLGANSGVPISYNDRGFSVWNNSGGTLSTGGGIIFHWIANAEL